MGKRMTVDVRGVRNDCYPHRPLCVVQSGVIYLLHPRQK
jgi:hypothetical protein